MPMITDFAEPRDAREVAQTIKLFLADHFGFGFSGGLDATGAELVTDDPEAEGVRITVRPWDEKFSESEASRRGGSDVDRFDEPLARYFAASVALDELESAVSAGRISRSWEGLDPLVDQHARSASEAKDELLILVRETHGVAPGEKVKRSLVVEVPGALLVLPCEYGDPIDGCDIVVVPQGAVVRVG